MASLPGPYKIEGRIYHVVALLPTSEGNLDLFLNFNGFEALLLAETRIHVYPARGL